MRTRTSFNRPRWLADFDYAARNTMAIATDKVHAGGEAAHVIRARLQSHCLAAGDV
jgi:hypothetical protein